MTLSSALVGALKSFNERDPMTRSGMLPVTDGLAFLNRAVSPPSDQSPAVPGRGSLPRGETEVASQAKRELIEGASDSLQKAKLDPYVFSPPGMDIR